MPCCRLRVLSTASSKWTYRFLSRRLCAGRSCLLCIHPALCSCVGQLLYCSAARFRYFRTPSADDKPHVRQRPSAHRLRILSLIGWSPARGGRRRKNGENRTSAGRGGVCVSGVGWRRGAPKRRAQRGWPLAHTPAHPTDAPMAGLWAGGEDDWRRAADARTAWRRGGDSRSCMRWRQRRCGWLRLRWHERLLGCGRR